MNRKTFLALLIPLCLGCGSLSVQVDIANPAVARSALDALLLENTLPYVRAQNDLAIDGLVDELKQVHKDAYIELQRQYQQEANQLPDKQKRDLLAIAGPLVTDFEVANNQHYDDLRVALKQIASNVRAVDISPDSPERTSRLVQLLRQRDQQLANFRTFVERDIGSKANEALQRLGSHADLTGMAAATERTRTVTRSLIGDYNLVSSAEAYQVVHAGPNNWQPIYDRSYGRARLGDMNLAIKMESLGTFTIKGVTFDPSEVVRVAAKVTSQALVVATQLAGVPLATKQYDAGTSGSALAASTGALQTLEYDEAVRVAKANDRTLALLSLANLVLDVAPDLAADSTRPAAIKMIKDAYDAQKARITQ